MEKFIVSARKYRPKCFAALKGQAHVVKTLQNAIKHKQIASAFLFCGLKGSGKTTSARLLARAINCDQTTPVGNPCNACMHCTASPSFNIHELDAASHNSAEEMRQLVEQIRYHSPNGKKTVIIIDEAHMLSNAALNVLLKPLEDTPPHVIFILVTTEKHKIISTILSRCQVFDFHHIETAEIVVQLQYVAQEESISCEEEALQLISEKAEGSLRDALSMFDSVAISTARKEVTYADTLRYLNLLDARVYFDIIEALHQGRIGQVLSQYDTVVRTGFSGLQFVNGLGEHLRNLLVAQVDATLFLIKGSPKLQKAYQKKTNDIQPLFIYEALDLIQGCALHYKTSLNQRLHVELMLIKVGRLHQVAAEQVQEGEKSVITLDQSKSLPFQKISITTSARPPLPSKSPQRTVHASKPKIYNLEGSLPSATMALAESDPEPRQRIKSVTSTNVSPRETPKKKEYSRSSEVPKDSIKRKKRTIGIPSLKVLQASIKEEAKCTAPESFQNRSVTMTEIIPHWRAYTELLKKKGDFQSALILQQSFRLEAKNLILSLINPSQACMLTQVKPRLLAFLQEKLTVNGLTLSTAYAPQKEGKQPYSDEEKLQDLMKNYPEVEHLKQKLGLRT